MNTGEQMTRNKLLAVAAALLAPAAAMLVQMAISRSREYNADRVGAEICGNPIWLASALQRIQASARSIHMESAERVPASAHLFIINPLLGGTFDNLFSTHPSTENRVQALRELAQDMGTGGFLDGGSRIPPRKSGHKRGPWG